MGVGLTLYSIQLQRREHLCFRWHCLAQVGCTVIAVSVPTVYHFLTARLVSTVLESSAMSALHSASRQCRELAMHIGELLAEHLLQADEEQVLSKRLAGYFAVLKSNDYVYVRSCLQLEHMPASPSPADRQLSKRGWEIKLVRFS